MAKPITGARFHSDKTWNQTIAELHEAFALWGIGRGEWGVTALNPGSGAEVWYYLPYDPERKSISCLSQWNPATNLRACYMVAVELQRAAKRGIRIASGVSQILALPAGGDAPNVGPAAEGQPRGGSRKSRFRDLREACAVLGITTDASQEDAEDMYRVRARRLHPDNTATGNEENFKKLAEAWEMIQRRRGWGTSSEVA